MAAEGAKRFAAGQQGLGQASSPLRSKRPIASTSRAGGQLPHSTAALTLSANGKRSRIDSGGRPTGRAAGRRGGARGLSQRRLCALEAPFPADRAQRISGANSAGPELPWVARFHPHLAPAQHAGNRGLQPGISADGGIFVGPDAARVADCRLRTDAVLCLFPNLSEGRRLPRPFRSAGVRAQSVVDPRAWRQHSLGAQHGATAPRRAAARH